MRKLSRKWFIWFTAVAFALPAWYLFHRIFTYPGTFNGKEFLGRVVGAAFISGIAWAVYAIARTLARKVECPSCGGENIAKYLYGISKVTSAIEHDFEAGRAVLGGGVAKKDSPKWYCNDCQHEW